MKISSIWVHTKRIFEQISSETALLRNSKNTLTITFNKAPNNHYYICLTALAFKKYDYAWIRLCKECNISHLSILKLRRTTFNPDFPLKNVNESIEDLPDDIFLHFLLQENQTYNTQSTQVKMWTADTLITVIFQIFCQFLYMQYLAQPAGVSVTKNSKVASIEDTNFDT